MPNPTNGVRSGTLKRSDQKRDKDLSSPNSRDLSRRDTKEPENPIALLAHSSGAIQRLADVAQYFRSFTHDVKVVEEDYGDEIDNVTEIRRLKETVEVLTHSKSEEMERLRHQNEELLAEKRSYQEDKKQGLEMKEKLETHYALLDATRQEESKKKLQDEKIKLHKQVNTKKAEFEEEVKQKFREVEEKHVQLSATNAELKQRSLEAEEKLEKKKKIHTLTKNSLIDTNKNLSEQLTQVKAEFPIEGKPVEY